MTSEQVIVVGLIASVLTFVLKMVFQYFNWTPGRAVMSIVLYVIAFILAGVWSGVMLPPFPPSTDPVSFVAAVLQFISDLLAQAAPVVGLATLIYNLLYEKVVVPAVNKLFAKK